MQNLKDEKIHVCVLLIVLILLSFYFVSLFKFLKKRVKTAREIFKKIDCQEIHNLLRTSITQLDMS